MAAKVSCIKNACQAVGADECPLASKTRALHLRQASPGSSAEEGPKSNCIVLFLLQAQAQHVIERDDDITAGRGMTSQTIQRTAFAGSDTDVIYDLIASLVLICGTPLPCAVIGPLMELLAYESHIWTVPVGCWTLQLLAIAFTRLTLMPLM